MDNVVVQFDAETAGLESAVDVYDQVINADGKLVQQAKNSAAIMQQSYKDTSAAIGSNVASVGSLAKAFQNLDKSVTAGSYKKVLTDIRTQLQLTDQQAKTFYQNIVKNSQTQLLAPGTNDDLTQLKTVLQAATENLDDMGTSSIDVATKTLTLKTQLRALKNELSGLNTSDPEFAKIATQAGLLEQKIKAADEATKLFASHTTGISAGIQAVEGLTAAYSVAVGVEGLFGAKNEELQQALLKVQSAMSILNGLQSLGNVLSKDSELNAFLLKTLRLQEATAIDAAAASTENLNVAQEGNVVVTEAETVATEELNTAMAANPAAVLILGITALIGLYEVLKTDTEAASKAQDKYNTSFEQGKEILDSNIDAIKNAHDQLDAELKSTNASGERIRANDLYSVQQQAENIKKYLDANTQNYQDADDKLREIAQKGTFSQQQTKVVTDDVDPLSGGSGETRTITQNVEVKPSDDYIKSLQKTVDDYNAVDKQKSEADEKLATTSVEQNAAANKEKLADDVAYAEASLANTQAGSKAELEAQLNLITVKENAELASAYHSNAEIAQIQTQANKDRQAKELEITLYDLNQAKIAAQDKVDIAVKGSQDELNATIGVLEAEKNIEIANAEGNQKTIQEIKDRYRQQELLKIQAFNKQVAEDTINTNISQINDQIYQKQLDGAKDTDDSILKLKENLIEQQANLDILDVQNSTKSEEQKRIQIKTIYDKELVDKQQLELAKAKAGFDSTVQAQQDNFQQQKSVLDQLSSLVGSYGKSRIDINNMVYENEVNNINALKSQNIAALALGFETMQEYKKQEQDLDNKTTQLEISNAESVAQEKINSFNTYAGYFDKGISAIFNADKQSLQNQLSNSQNLYSQKLITQQEYNAQQAKLKKEEAVIDKAKAEFDILLDAAKQIFAVESQAATLAANPLTAALAPIALAQIPRIIIQEAIALGLVAASGFKSGVVGLKGPGTETSDSIPAWLSRNESVITAEATRRYGDALLAMNELRFPEWMAANNIKVPQPSYLNDMIFPEFDMPSFSGGQEIDYDKVGEAVAKHVGKINDMPQSGIVWDAQGIRQWIKEDNRLTEYRNQRYNRS